jgi:hypothetical protein
MNVDHPSAYQERRESVPPFQMHITSYKLHEIYYCWVDDVDPGAVIARSKGDTRQDAEEKAVKKAKERLDYSRTRYEQTSKKSDA